MLVKLDKEYTSSVQSSAWEDYYARGLDEHFTAT
jgi:hypothetical protein